MALETLLVPYKVPYLCRCLEICGGAVWLGPRVLGASSLAFRPRPGARRGDPATMCTLQEGSVPKTNAERQPDRNAATAAPSGGRSMPLGAAPAKSWILSARRLVVSLLVGGAMALTSASVPAASQTACDWVSYPDFCIPPYPPDLECWQIGAGWFTVNAPDPHSLDGDFDGIGCEG